MEARHDPFPGAVSVQQDVVEVLRKEARFPAQPAQKREHPLRERRWNEALLADETACRQPIHTHGASLSTRSPLRAAGSAGGSVVK